MRNRNRVVITGMGVLAPNGTGLEAFWSTLLEGKSGIGPITLFDATKFKSRIAGEVKNFQPLDYIEAEQKPKRMARHTQLAYAATMMALKDAGLNIDRLELPSPTPVVIGVSTSAIDVLERVFRSVEYHGPDNAPPTALASSNPQAAANTIADRIGLAAHAATVSSACPSGLDAVARAADMIRNGEADIAIAGGADAPITPITVASFIEGGLSGSTNGDPSKASRPFDFSRRYGVLSEGAAVFVLENLERAEARGAETTVEIAGYAMQRDSHPSKPLSGLADSMLLALANASCRQEDVDYICAYGPSDPLLDAIEVKMIKQVFGRRAYEIPISSIKGVTGNPLAAGGPFQLVTCALSIRDQTIAPTTNFEVGDAICDLDFVPLRRRKIKLNHALINVRGLGGGASTMIVNRVIT